MLMVITANLVISNQKYSGIVMLKGRRQSFMQAIKSVPKKLTIVRNVIVAAVFLTNAALVFGRASFHNNILRCSTIISVDGTQIAGSLIATSAKGIFIATSFNLPSILTRRKLEMAVTFVSFDAIKTVQSNGNKLIYKDDLSNGELRCTTVPPGN